MSLADRYNTDNLVESITHRINTHYLPCHKDWNKYKLNVLFPEMHYLGDIYSRYDIFVEEEKGWL